MTALEEELDACGGATAPATATARLRQVLTRARARARSSPCRAAAREEPVEIGIAAQSGHLLAATPADAAPGPTRRSPPGEWLLVAAAVGALIDLAGAPAPHRGRPRAEAASSRRLPRPRLPGDGLDPELAGLAFEEHATTIDRLKAVAYALPPSVIDDVPLKKPIGAGHPLKVAGRSRG
jgi:hypothetical protein